jgi:hypothetical protein
MILVGLLVRYETTSRRCGNDEIKLLLEHWVYWVGLKGKQGYLLSKALTEDHGVQSVLLFSFSSVVSVHRRLPATIQKQLITLCASTTSHFGPL